MKSERIYHIYPLGFTGANQDHNDGVKVKSLQAIIPLIPHMKSLNTTVLQLGPIFESETHGYDTVDYNHVDRRLGKDEDLIALVKACHDNGIKVMLDCVFNHIARGHGHFQNLRSEGQNSKYKTFIKGVNFNQDNAHHDGFTYENWGGHDQLVKLELDEQQVRDWLIGTAIAWIDRFDIDGLRMDAADVMSQQFLRALSDAVKSYKKGFMMLGEVIHGDYNQWLDEGGMDAITNYEAHKGLWSSLNDANYHEIAYALNRQFGYGGVYPAGSMVNFTDNHDVNRVATVIENKAHLYPLYLMLYTMPGVPALYYGSEMGVEGKKACHSDTPLRPDWFTVETQKNEDLLKTVQKLSKIHADSVAIREGGYQQIHIDHKVIGYKRQWAGKDVYVFINAKDDEVTIPTPMVHGKFYDLLNEETIEIQGHVTLYSNWGRIMMLQ